MSFWHWIFIIVPSLTYPLICLTYILVLKQKHEDIRRLMKGKTLAKYLKAYGNEDIFKQYYDWRGYILPVLINMIFVEVLILGLLIKYSNLSQNILQVFSLFNSLPATTLIGFLGAYLWTHYDMLRRFYVIDLTPVSMHYMWLRLLVCGILAYLIGQMLQTPFDLLAAFAIGTFPLHRLSGFLQSQIQEKFASMADSKEYEKPNLHLIQGMNKYIMDRFEEENIYTVEHLALANPLRFLLRTNIEWTVILDLIDQAILINYIGEKINDIRQTGIRCAMEFSDIQNELENKDENRKAMAESLVNVFAQKLNWDKSCVQNLIRTLEEDAQLNFIYYLWEDAFSDEESESNDKNKPAPNTLSNN